MSDEEQKQKRKESNQLLPSPPSNNSGRRAFRRISLNFVEGISERQISRRCAMLNVSPPNSFPPNDEQNERNSEKERKIDEARERDRRAAARARSRKSGISIRRDFRIRTEDGRLNRRRAATVAGGRQWRPDRHIHIPGEPVFTPANHPEFQGSYER